MRDGYIDLGSDACASHDDELRILSHCFQILEHSPAACALMDKAAMHDWAVTLSDLEDAQDYHIDMPERKIIINMDGLSHEAIARSPYFQTYILSALVRSLRDAEQETYFHGFDANHTPEDILFFMRARYADLAVMNILIAWELRAQGDNALWRHVVGAEDGDIALRFIAALEKEGTHRNDALRKAFDQWYKNTERVDAADHDALNIMDMIIAEEREDTGTLNPFGARKMDADVLIKLSCLYDKTAYLCTNTADILRDPFYAGLSDEVNQTHFMQMTRDIMSITINNVPFRSESLARRMFPNRGIAYKS
jgi:hypothetical protein